MATEIDIKTQRLTDWLNRSGYGGVLLNGQHNFAWITGGASNGVDQSRENGAASILVTHDGRRYLLANRIEMPRMLAEQVSANDFEPTEFSWQDEKSSGQFLIGLANDIAARAPVVTDVPIDSSAPAMDSEFAHCRYELTEQEIERYRLLGADAGKAMRDIFDKIAPGETEAGIAAKMRSELAAYGIQSVVTLVAADGRLEKFRHPLPTLNMWNKTIMLVTCAKRGGLIASLSRIACVGEVPKDLMAKTEAGAVVNAHLWDATKVGATATGLYQVAADGYSECGFADEINMHHQGGATGYRTRDWVAHPSSSNAVAENQAFAWNPSITGTKVEETVIVTKSGVETFTTSPDFPAIVTTINGRDFSSPGILNIH